MPLHVAALGLSASIRGPEFVVAMAEIAVASARKTRLLAPYSEAIGRATVVVTITMQSRIVGELVPKRLAPNSPEWIASRVARPMAMLATASGPVVWFLTIATDGILRVLGVGPAREEAITEEEVRVLIAEGTHAGVFDEAERSVLESAFDLSETRVVSLMTPRTLVDWVDVSEPIERTWNHMADSVHRYYPLCRGSVRE